jgi:predicted O-methyltransferase YrrM
MPVPKPVHIEEHDPRFYAFRQSTYLKWTIWGAGTVLAGLLLGHLGIALSLMVLGYLLFSTLLQIYHRLQIQQVRDYWQIEALFSLYSTLRITHPLPPMRLWAASPDFVNLSVSLIRQHHPQLVFEIGSGVSTVVSSYALREAGSGILISLEHEQEFSAVTAANIAAHQMQDIAAVRHAPLKPVTLDNQPYQWYDTQALQNLPGLIDLLVVDGPPSGTGKMARYPAVPMLYHQLRPGAFILVDDFMREDEYQMVNRWLEQFDLRVIQTFANEKGAVILQKPPEAALAL